MNEEVLRKPLLKSEIAQVLGLNRSEQLITYGYIDDEVLTAGKFKNLQEYKKRHLLLIPAVEAIFKKDNVTWVEAYTKLNATAKPLKTKS